MSRRSIFTVLRELGAEPKPSDRNIPLDYKERDEILRKALTWMGQHCRYFPLDVEEDISISYAEDSLEDFKETVRMWLRDLQGASNAS